MDIADDAVMRILEDRGLRILVYRYDAVGVLHAGDVLECPGYAHGEVDLRLDGLSRRSDLARLRKPHLVDDRAATPKARP